MGPRKAKTDFSYDESTPQNPDPGSKIIENSSDPERALIQEEVEEVGFTFDQMGPKALTRSCSIAELKEEGKKTVMVGDGGPE